MTFVAPIAEQRFVLTSVAGIEELGVDPELTDAILDGAGAFAQGEFAPLNRVGDQVGARYVDGRVIMPKGFREAYRAYVESGWSSLSASQAHGGQGLPLTLATVVLEDLGTANFAFTLCPMLSNGAIEALEAHGSDEQKLTYMSKLVSGEWTGTMNLTEPQAGSDVGALRTTARPNGDGSWAIKGSKIYITFGDHDLADNIVHLVLARTPDAPAGTKGISLFVVPKLRQADDGSWTEPNDVRCASIEHKLGIHASPTCTMVYGDRDDCRGWLVGAEHAGMRAMFTMMNNARLNVGLQGVQVAEAATQQAIAYAQGREQMGQAIIDFPDVRRMLLRMKALTQGARALAYYAASCIDRGGDDASMKARADLLIPLVKAWGTDIGVEVASLGIQVHGGMGFVEETGAAQYYRDARIAPIYEGTNGIQAADLVGRKLALEGGDTVRRLLDELEQEATGEHALLDLLRRCRTTVTWLTAASPADRLAGSYPFLTLLSVVVAGGLLVRQGRLAGERLEAGAHDAPFLKAKLAVVRFFLDRIVPEALGLAGAATAGADGLFALTAEELAA